MIGFILVAIVLYFAGDAIARRFFEGSERIAAAGVLGAGAWIAVLWSLAIAHQLNRRNLVIAVVAFALVAALSLRRMRSRQVSSWTLAILLPIVLWTIFILWRSTVVPPQNHDAMTYHLPKAILLVQAEGYERFASPDVRLAAFPSNFELVLASVLVLEGSDRLTEWVSTAFYLLFLAITAMVAERWWGRGLHVGACVLAAAGMPLLLLHSGADKNDVMAGAFACGALSWGAQWCVARRTPPLVLATICGALAVGTKMTTAGIAFALAPFLLIAVVRRPPRLRDFAATLAFAAAAFLLLGGWVFVSNAMSPPLAHPDANPVLGGAIVSRELQWANLWQVPVALVRVSLGFQGPVYWPKYNVINSNFGVLFGLAALLLPFVIRRYRREGEDGVQRERLIAMAAAVATVLAFLPLVPRHTLAAMARYAVVLVPFVLGWSVAPLLRDRSPRVTRAALAVLVAMFALEAVAVARHDTFVSLHYLRWAMAHPGTRWPSWPPARAASYADAMAGPNDTIAFAGGPDGWAYPLYGRGFTRRVHLLGGATWSDIPPDAQWLVIDRAPAPGSRPAPADERLMHDAMASGRFERVHHDPNHNQVVLRRLESRP